MDYAIFKSEEEKKAAVNDLESLMEHPGWRIISKALDINEEYFDNTLHDTDFTELRPMERLQDRIRDLRKLKQLPKLLLEARKEEFVAREEDDTYDFPAEQVQPKQ